MKNTIKRRVLRKPIERTLCITFIANMLMAGSVTGSTMQQFKSMAFLIVANVIIAIILARYGDWGE